MIRHIVKKDARRLWPLIAASLAMLASLAWQDRRRASWLPQSAEVYLSLLLPILWGCLVALAVEQEPIPGDRQFWITRPYKRPELLFAKLLFAAMVVHLPGLVADCWIVAGRGFAPLAYLPQLVWKQALLACALTIPVMALASLVRSFSQFVLELVALAVFIIVVTDLPGSTFSTWQPLETLRLQLTMFVAAGAGAAILAIQYLERRILLSRGVAIAGALAGAVVFFYLLPQSALAVRTTVSPARAQLALRLDPPRAGWSGYGNAPIPVSVVGLPDGMGVRVDVVRSELAGSSGVQFREKMQAENLYNGRAYSLGIADGGARASKWMNLNLHPATFAQLKNGPVTIRGEASMMLYRGGRAVSMPVGGTTASAEVGRCASQEVGNPTLGGWLLVQCESPESSTYRRLIRVWSPETGRDWQDTLHVPSIVSAEPAGAWLSPIVRGQSSFNFSDASHQGQIPKALLRDARVEVTPLKVVGYSAVKFEFRDVDLRKYVYIAIP